MIETAINTCYATTSYLRDVAFYAHLIPMAFSLFLGFLVFLKASKSVLSKIFISFAIAFFLWLAGDLIAWTSNNYHLIYATWSLLVYFEVLFFVLGFYFTTIIIRRGDLPLWGKIGLFLTTLFPWFITITQQSVTGFNYPVCEAFNNTSLDNYKLYLEIVILGIMFVYMLVPFFRKDNWSTKKTNFVIAGSMFLFLSVFGITEYLAGVTGNYELNLYSLFVVPVFLIAITYSIFSLDVFDLKIVSTYFLVFGFLILMGAQLLFVTGTANFLLTALTLIMSVSISFLLFRNLHKESDQRERIEHLNRSLRDLIKQRESLVHLVTHKVKGSFTRTKLIFAGILDGTFGDINPEVKKIAEKGLEFDNGGIETVDLVLNAANLENGLIKYEMKEVDLEEIVRQTAEEKKLGAENKGLKLETDLKEGKYRVLGDAFWLKEVVNNLIENSIKYTKEGKIAVELGNENGKALLAVKDTGLGITEEDKHNLFTEGGRGKNSVKVNVDSTGYGLYTVKMVVEAHKGSVWAESEGENKGSQFYVELPLA